MLAGVRPTIRFASAPIASTALRLRVDRDDRGSLMTIPRSRTWTSVFAVPRSMPMSREKRPSRRSNMIWCGSFLWGLSASRGRRCGSARGFGRGRRSIPGRLPHRCRQTSRRSSDQWPAPACRRSTGPTRDERRWRQRHGVERVGLADLTAGRDDDHQRRLEPVHDAAPQPVRREQPARRVAHGSERVRIERAGDAGEHTGHPRQPEQHHAHGAGRDGRNARPEEQRGGEQHDRLRREERDRKERLRRVWPVRSPPAPISRKPEAAA